MIMAEFDNFAYLEISWAGLASSTTLYSQVAIMTSTSRPFLSAIYGLSRISDALWARGFSKGRETSANQIANHWKLYGLDPLLIHFHECCYFCNNS